MTHYVLRAAIIDFDRPPYRFGTVTSGLVVVVGDGGVDVVGVVVGVVADEKKTKKSTWLAVVCL